MALPLFSTKKSGAEKTSQALLNQANDLTNLMLNPNDPRFKNMLQAETQNVRGGYLQNLRDMIEANRRQALMGRQQIFDPERRDEGMFSAVNKAGMQAQQEARGNLLNRINQSISQLQNQSQANLGLAGMANQRNDQQRQSILALLNSGVKAGGLFL